MVPIYSIEMCLPLSLVSFIANFVQNFAPVDGSVIKLP